MKNKILKEFIDKFKVVAPLMLPTIIDDTMKVEEYVYDDYALLNYTVPNPMSIDELMDMLEDKMELIMLYHVLHKTIPKGAGCCAYSNPVTDQMYKVNAVTSSDNLIHSISVTIYDSLEFMCFDILEDRRLNEEHGEFLYQRDLSQIVIDFS